MQIKAIGDIAVVRSDSADELIITDPQSALDLIATLRYDHSIAKIAVPKEAVNEDFFRLPTGLAGEVAQKFVNYRSKLAIFGDYSKYSSKPLKDFMAECNRGSQMFFVGSEEEAVEKLSQV